MSILINVYLMVNMRMVTWIQYSVYMALGKPFFDMSSLPLMIHVHLHRALRLHYLRMETQQGRTEDAGQRRNKLITVHDVSDRYSARCPFLIFTL